jgi:hypothetical protein
MKNRFQKPKIIYVSGIFILLTACTPGPPPPPPPIFPGFEWLIIALVVFLGVFLWKKYLTQEPVNTNYITEALNAINQQLKELEKKIDELEKKQDQ